MAAVPAVPTAETARLIAERGWRVFPVRPRTKRPLNEHGSAEATSDAATVAAWWGRWPWASIGALVPQRLVVVDIDPRNGCALHLGHPFLDPTLTVATGGGGWHLYHQAPPGIELGAHSEAFPGVDLIRAGRQVILPPSLHPSGEEYRWLVDLPPAPLPGRLVDAFTVRRFPRYVVNGFGRTRVDHGGGEVPGRRYIEAARRGIVAHLAADAVPGNRHNALNAAAFRYWQLGLDETDALADLLPVVPLAADFTEAEVRLTIASVWR